MQTIAVASGKGGVGKSTITTQLACLLANNGYKVGVIDADIYGPCQYGLLGANDTQAELDPNNKIIPGYSAKHKVFYISVNNLLENSEDSPMLWRAPIATKLIRDFLNQVAWPELDFLLLDLPPGTGDVQITIAQLAKLDGAIIVTTPQKVAYSIAAKAIQMFNKVNVKILGVIENMSGYICSNCQHENHIFDYPNHEVDTGGTVLANKYQVNLLGKIPLAQNLVALSDDGSSIMDLPDNNPVKTSFFNIVTQLLLKLSSVKERIAYEHKLISNGAGLEITTTCLEEGSKTHKQKSAYDLRIQCPCALCVDENTGRKLINKNLISHNITIINVKAVGNYGLKLTFSDGHGTGIYILANF